MNSRAKLLVKRIQTVLDEYNTSEAETPAPPKVCVSGGVTKVIGDHFKALRKSHGVSVRAWAKMLGIANVTVYRIENGTHLPGLSILYQFADRLEVSVQDLIPDRRWAKA